MIHTDDNLRDQYNAMSERRWRSQFTTKLPPRLSSPQSVDDFLQLSDLILCGYEHACAIGEWCHNSDRGSRPSRNVIKWIALDVFGLRLINILLNDADRFDYLKIFNAVSPLPLSIHAQLRDAIRQQTITLLMLYGDLADNGLDLKRFASCDPNLLAAYRDDFMVDAWHEPDSPQQIVLAKAEMAKVEFHLTNQSSTVGRRSPKTRGPVKESRDEQIYQLWLQNEKGITKAWNAWNSKHYGEDQLQYEAFKRALYRIRARKATDQLKASDRDK